jgi:hypothetical protein
LRAVVQRTHDRRIGDRFMGRLRDRVMPRLSKLVVRTRSLHLRPIRRAVRGDSSIWCCRADLSTYDGHRRSSVSVWRYSSPRRPDRRGHAMTRSRRFARISLTSARWLLPWIAVLFGSVTLAYAVTGAVHGGAQARDRQRDVQGAVALSTDEATTSMALEWLQESRSRAASIDELFDDAALKRSSSTHPSGVTFGVMSNTSPASTGHASPAGCCTWN